MQHNYGYLEKDNPGSIGDLRLWSRILWHAKFHWKKLTLAILLSLIITMAGLTLPYLVSYGVDHFIADTGLGVEKRIMGLSALAFPFLSLTVITFLANFLQIALLERTGQKIMHRIRQQLFEHLLNMDIAFFHDRSVGRLVTRLTNDIQNMHEMFTSVIVTLFNDLIRILGILAVLIWFNRNLGLLVTLFLPAIILFTIWFSRYARKAFLDIRIRLAKINGYLQESIQGIAIIRIFAREAAAQDRFDRHNLKYYAATLHQIRIFSIFMPLMEMLSTLATAVIIWYGGGQIVQGKMTIGILVAFLAYSKLFFQPVRELTQKYSIVQSAMASTERVFDLLDHKPQQPPLSRPLIPDRISGKLQFKTVSFGYQPQTPVINNFSLLINPGETVAIVGPTGAGKSTLINLLERFYLPDQGVIELDGRDIRELDINWLRRQLGLVMQDVYLSPETLRQNILLEEPADTTRIARIIKEAQLEDVVRRLPRGLDTVIGEGGIELSAGQKQLVAFARVLARNPKILILDEATANVDTSTELLIQEAIARLLKERTAIVIAHRLSTVRKADRILVMANGRIIEQGSHDELMTRKGHYFRLLDYS